MAAVLLVGVILVAGVVLWGLRRFNDISFVDVPGVEPAAEGTADNWLLVGTDGRDGIDPGSPDAAVFLGEEVVGQRADTIMVARVDATARTIDILSITRDLWVPIDGGDHGRINGADREELVSTLSAVLDIDINYYAEVNFVGFQDVVDSLGGVAVWFGNPARDERSGLQIAETGCHILDGAQSLAYARGRTFEEFVDGEWKLDPTGDLGRIARQRIFLFRSIAAAKGQLDLSKLGALDNALTVGGQNLLIEDGASMTDLISIARVFASADAEHFTGHALPVEDQRTTGGAQVLGLRSDEAEPVLEIFREGTAPSGPGTPAEGSATPAEELDEGADESAENSPPEQPEQSVPSYPITFPTEPGYGTFGFVAAPTPAGTPCS